MYASAGVAMMASRTIVEVLRRSDQGFTRPFVCRADDDALYYVKGADAGLDSLCHEWVAGNLARKFGLPVPPFVIAEVPTTLVKESVRSDIGHLGSGRVFASRALEDCREVTWAEAAACDEQLKASILLFDWWVHNEDRKLSEAGGNPNLLVTPDGPGARVWAFDFNLAFDDSFNTEVFWSDHIFGGMLPAWPSGFRELIIPVLESCAEQLDSLFESLPIEWLYIGGDDTMDPRLDLQAVRATLFRAFEQPDEFWSRP